MLWIKIKSKLLKIKRVNISWIIFGITILLLLSITVPRLFQRYAFYSLLSNNINLPYELKLSGKLVSDEKQIDYSDFTVYVGGYCQKVEKDGNFEIDFLADSKDEIVVVVMKGENTISLCSKISLSTEEIKYFDIGK